MAYNAELFLTDRMLECTWMIDEIQTAPGYRSGAGNVIKMGYPRWIIKAKYNNLDDALIIRKQSAWIARREKSANPFTAFRPLKRKPLNAPSGSNSGLGISGVDIASGTIDVTGCSWDISEGDMVSYRTSVSGLYVGEVKANVSQGSTMTLPVWPPPFAPHASAPDLKLVDAVGEFQLLEMNPLIEVPDRKNNWDFTAKQVVRLV